MANTVPMSSQPLFANSTGTTGQIASVLGVATDLGRSIYLTGFSYQASGATTATTVTITIYYAPAGNGAAVVLGNYSYPIGTTTTTFGNALTVNFIPPITCPVPILGTTNTNTSTATGSIAVQASAAGAGATFTGLTVWGYML